MSFYHGRTALVTGASSGIGEAVARRLAREGARLALVARGEAALGRLAADLGPGTAVLAQDLARPGAAQALAARVVDAGLEVDILVNNAGYGLAGPFAALDADEQEEMIALNCAALTGLTRRLLPGMLARRRGGVLHVASTAAFAPAPTLAVYAATKAYVLRLSQALHAELRGTGVHCTCLCPGPVPTGFGARAGMHEGFFRTGGLLRATTSPERVAREGLSALARNRRQVVVGALNKAQAFGTRLAPTALTLRVAEAVLRP